METPRSLRAVEEADVPVRKYEYDDGSVVAVDFGGSAGDQTVDVVGDTAIVVVDDEQVEFHLPEEADDVSVRGGVLTIET